MPHDLNIIDKEQEDTFIITYDHLENKTLNLYFCEKSQLESLKSHRSQLYPFHLYDDDHNLIYSGLSSSKDSMSPIDMFGFNDSGCTEIKYI